MDQYLVIVIGLTVVVEIRRISPLIIRYKTPVSIDPAGLAASGIVIQYLYRVTDGKGPGS